MKLTDAKLGARVKVAASCYDTIDKTLIGKAGTIVKVRRLGVNTFVTVQFQKEGAWLGFWLEELELV